MANPPLPTLLPGVIAADDDSIRLPLRIPSPIELERMLVILSMIQRMEDGSPLPLMN